MDNLADTRARFLDDMETLGQAEYLPPIAGRLLGILMFDGKTHSFSDLAEALNVSRASISTSARRLEDDGLVARVREPGKRGDYFCLADAPYAKMLSIKVAHLEQYAQMVQKNLSALPPDENGARARLTELLNFYKSTTQGLREALAAMNGAADDATHEI